MTVTSSLGSATGTAIAYSIAAAMFLLDSQRAAALNLDGSIVAPTAGAHITVTIGGKLAHVSFAGLVSPGLYQVNVVVPDVPDGDNQVNLQVQLPSQNTSVLAVQH